MILKPPFSNDSIIMVPEPENEAFEFLEVISKSIILSFVQKRVLPE
jgi:hypothetical protein